MLGISWLVEELLASQEGLYFMRLVTVTLTRLTYFARLTFFFLGGGDNFSEYRVSIGYLTLWHQCNFPYIERCFMKVMNHGGAALLSQCQFCRACSFLLAALTTTPCRTEKMRSAEQRAVHIRRCSCTAVCRDVVRIANMSPSLATPPPLLWSVPSPLCVYKLIREYVVRNTAMYV